MPLGLGEGRVTHLSPLKSKQSPWASISVNAQQESTLGWVFKKELLSSFFLISSSSLPFRAKTHVERYTQEWLRHFLLWENTIESGRFTSRRQAFFLWCYRNMARPSILKIAHSQMEYWRWAHRSTMCEYESLAVGLMDVKYFFSEWN